MYLEVKSTQFMIKFIHKKNYLNKFTVKDEYKNVFVDEFKENLNKI